MPAVDVSNARLWYSDIGSGKPVLLIHGGLFDPMDGERFWQRPGVVADLLAAGYRVLLPDRRYCGGKTTSDVAIHTWDTEAADLAAILQHARITCAHVIAGSNGCSAAVRLAASHRTFVASLLLCCPPDLGDVSLALFYAFDVTDWLAEHGPPAYVARLDREGVPRPGYDVIGFPFGVSLLHDARARASFLARTPAEAAHIIRATAGALLSGTALRGMSQIDADVIGREGYPVGIVPPQPEDLWHTLAAAVAVSSAIAGARLLPGFPVTQSPHFTSRRTDFATVTTTWLAQAER